MKKIILVRHAKSSWDDPRLRDIDRPLNPQGITDAALMGHHINARPSLVVASQALRTRETATIILDTMGINNAEIIYSKPLYLADSEQLHYIIGHLDNRHDCVMLIAHNPGIADFIDTYTNVLPSKVPTGSVFELHYNCDTWEGLGTSRPDTTVFHFPAMYRSKKDG